jgi:hypothetical protein
MRELPVQPGLADSGLADECQHPALAGACLIEGAAQDVELLVSTDKAGETAGG